MARLLLASFEKVLFGIVPFLSLELVDQLDEPFLCLICRVLNAEVQFGLYLGVQGASDILLSKEFRETLTENQDCRMIGIVARASTHRLGNARANALTQKCCSSKTLGKEAFLEI